MEVCTETHNGDMPPQCIERLAQIRENWREVVEDLVCQFAYHGNDDTRHWLHTGGLSALESAFDALGWDDPHYMAEGGCEHDGCHKWATCGTPTPEGYKRLCSDHGLPYFRSKTTPSTKAS